MAEVYSNLYNMKITGLRFFTVFGIYGRPDMAMYKFVNSILNKKQVYLYNSGKNVRDFTYVNDLVRMIKIITESEKYKKFEHEIFNLGSSRPHKISKIIDMLSKISNRKIKIKKIEPQIGDVKKTGASTKKFKTIYGNFHITNLSEALEEYFLWHKEYYNG